MSFETPFDDAPPQEYQQPQQRQEKQRPVWSRSYPAGNGNSIEAAVWPHEGNRDGQKYTFFTVSLTRRYFHASEKKYKDGAGFRESDLPIVAIAAQAAYLALIENRNK